MEVRTMTPEQKNAVGGFYCQNCSRVLVENQGGICQKCMEVRTMRDPNGPVASFDRGFWCGLYLGLSICAVIFAAGVLIWRFAR
jgi:hypothetical protein